MLISHSEIKNTVQKLDGIEFRSCTFENCTLVYEGGPPPSLRDCTFINSVFRFDGAARNTVDFLKAIRDPRSGLSVVFDSAFSGSASDSGAAERVVNDLESNSE